MQQREGGVQQRKGCVAALWGWCGDGVKQVFSLRGSGVRA